MSLLRELKIKAEIYEFLVQRENIQRRINEYLMDSNISSSDKADLHEFLEEVKLLEIL